MADIAIDLKYDDDPVNDEARVNGYLLHDLIFAARYGFCFGQYLIIFVVVDCLLGLDHLHFAFYDYNKAARKTEIVCQQYHTHITNQRSIKPIHA